MEFTVAGSGAGTVGSMDESNVDFIKTTIEVEIEAVPPYDEDGNFDEWNQWCTERGFYAMGGPRRAVMPNHGTYLGGAKGIVYWRGEIIGIWADELPSS